MSLSISMGLMFQLVAMMAGSGVNNGWAVGKGKGMEKEKKETIYRGGGGSIRWFLVWLID